MKVLFRVDSSYEIGIGHLMRCLVLAESLKKNGSKVEFICRSHEGNSIAKIISSDFKVYEMSVPNNQELEGNSKYSHWLGVEQEKDANDCIDIIKLEKVNWVVVDHYGIGEQWHKKIKRHCEKLMVIDDLADRNLDCNLLLNQNLGIDKKIYDKKVPTDCVLLLGTKFALLRTEFSDFRHEAIAKRKTTRSVNNVIVSIGGNDVDNLTHRILENIPNNYNVTAVLGKNSPHNKMLQKYIKGKNIKMVVDANNMAELMLNSDVAIGGGGSTSWERCCLSLPSLVFLIDENQKTIVQQLEKLGIVKLVVKPESIRSQLEDFNKNLTSWLLMSKKSEEICDGLGVDRVRNYIK